MKTRTNENPKVFSWIIQYGLDLNSRGTSRMRGLELEHFFQRLHFKKTLQILENKLWILLPIILTNLTFNVLTSEFIRVISNSNNEGQEYVLHSKAPFKYQHLQKCPSEKSITKNKKVNFICKINNWGMIYLSKKDVT